MMYCFFLFSFCVGYAFAVSSSDRCGTYGSNLPANFELSGMVFNKEEDCFVVVSDNGAIAKVWKDGEVLSYDYEVLNKNFSKGIYYYDDWESLSIVDDVIYIGVEWPMVLRSYNFSTHNLSDSKMIEFTEMIDYYIQFDTPYESGMEGHTYVPFQYNHGIFERGHFFCGVQKDGSIWIYEFDSTSQSVTFVKNMTFDHGSDGLPFPSDISSLSVFSDPTIKARYSLMVVVDNQNELYLFEIDDSTGFPSSSYYNVLHFPENLDQEGVLLLRDDEHYPDDDFIFRCFIATDDESHIIAEYLVNLEESTFLKKCIYEDNDSSALIISLLSTGLGLFIGVVLLLLCSVCFVMIIILLISFSGFAIFLQQKRLKELNRNMSFYDINNKNEEEEKMAHIEINNDLFEIDMNDIKMDQRIGSGGSGSEVFRAVWEEKVVAYKVFRTRDIASNQNSFSEFEREIRLLGSLKHPNIVTFWGASLKPPRIGIVMEFCANGELGKFIINYKMEKSHSYPYAEKIRLLTEISSAMKFIHSRNVIHRDLKCENVLINEEKHAKLVDFGLSKLVRDNSLHKTKRIGTSYYMAPEIVKGSLYDEKIDVFSFAILMFIVFSEVKGNPYPDKHSVEFRVANNPYYRPNLKKVGNLPKWIIDLLRWCWDDSSIKRMSFEEIHSILSQEKMMENRMIYLLSYGDDRSKAENFLLMDMSLKGLTNLVHQKFFHKKGRGNDENDEEEQDEEERRRRSMLTEEELQIEELKRQKEREEESKRPIYLYHRNRLIDNDEMIQDFRENSMILVSLEPIDEKFLNGGKEESLRSSMRKWNDLKGGILGSGLGGMKELMKLREKIQKKDELLEQEKEKSKELERKVYSLEKRISELEKANKQ